MVNKTIADRLISESMKSDLRYKHAAVILDRNLQAICYGHNQAIGPSGHDRRMSRHAEFHALKRLFSTAKYRGKKPFAILVVRVNPSGEFVKSDPCPKCVKLVEAAGLKTFLVKRKEK